jgi:gamma-glutamyl phosphate reductase
MTGLKDTPMSEIEAQARACRDAAQIVAGLDSAARRTLLLAMAQALEVNAGLILAGNARDLPPRARRALAVPCSTAWRWTRHACSRWPKPA